jgi:hypothetical protein
MPNLTAYAVLFLWPLVALILFRTLSPERAVIWTILGGYLFLPVRPSIDLPMLPAFEKDLIAPLSALIGALLVRKGWALADRNHAMSKLGAGPRVVAHTRFTRSDRVPAPDGTAQVARTEVAAGVLGQPLLSRGRIVGILLVALAGAVMTVLTNTEAVPSGSHVMPGLRLYDVFSMTLNFLVMMTPFIVGWRYFSGPAAQRAILVAFALGGALYAPLILFEVRMSPQLNIWVYGFFPHDFLQHIRQGGFRPVVFLQHGLWVGIFTTLAILASIGLWRVTPTGVRPWERLRWLVLAGGLLVVLVLAKSLGALMIAIVLGAVALFGGRRVVLLGAAGVAALVLLYPMARGLGLVPVEQVAALAEVLDAERAESFEFRLRSEDLLLEKADDKAVFGWGGWGRNLVHNEWGQQTAITDGAWIIVMGTMGWTGYLTQFGLLCLPLCLLVFRRDVPAETVFLSVVLAANLLDLIPNATLETITWLLAGAVAGTVLPQTVRSAVQGRGGVRRVDVPKGAVMRREVSAGRRGLR